MCCMFTYTIQLPICVLLCVHAIWALGLRPVVSPSEVLTQMLLRCVHERVMDVSVHACLTVIQWWNTGGSWSWHKVRWCRVCVCAPPHEHKQDTHILLLALGWCEQLDQFMYFSVYPDWLLACKILNRQDRFNKPSVIKTSPFISVSYLEIITVRLRAAAKVTHNVRVNGTKKIPGFTFYPPATG